MARLAALRWWLRYCIDEAPFSCCRSTFFCLLFAIYAIVCLLFGFQHLVCFPWILRYVHRLRGAYWVWGFPRSTAQNWFSRQREVGATLCELVQSAERGWSDAVRLLCCHPSCASSSCRRRSPGRRRGFLLYILLLQRTSSVDLRVSLFFR